MFISCIEGDEQRRQQVKSCLAEVYRKETSSSCTMLKHLDTPMLEDTRRTGAAEKNYDKCYRDLLRAHDGESQLGTYQGNCVCWWEHVEAEAGDSSAKTSEKRLKLDDRSIKSCAQNAMAISMKMLGSEDNRRAVGCALSAAQRVKRWYQPVVGDLNCDVVV